MPSLTEKLRFLECIFGKYTLSRDGLNASFVCPKCDTTDSRKKKLVVKLENDIFHCWVCGVKGKNLKRLIERFGTQSQLSSYISDFCQSELITGEIDEVDEKVSLPSDFKMLITHPCKSHPDSHAIYRYLTARSLTPDDFWFFKLGFSHEGNFRRRVIFPSFDAEGNLNYFAARSIDARVRPRYLNAQSDKTSIIFNEINICWNDELTLVEGPFDLVNCDQNATCLLGSFLSEQSYLFQKIVKNQTPVVLALDKDATQKSQFIAKKLIEYDVPVKMITLTSKNDVGEMTKDEFKKAKKSAVVVNRKDLILSKIKSISSTCFL